MKDQKALKLLTECVNTAAGQYPAMAEEYWAALREVSQGKNEWISVKDRLPEKEGWYHVAILDKKTGRVAVENDLYSIEIAKAHGKEEGFCKANRWEEREEITHWMPYPEPPSAREQSSQWKEEPK